MSESEVRAGAEGGRGERQGREMKRKKEREDGYQKWGFSVTIITSTPTLAT